MTLNEARDRLHAVAARQPVLAALAVSVLIHAFLLLTWRIGQSQGWWQHQPSFRLLTALFQRTLPPPPPARAPTPAAAEQPKVVPLHFVDVDPSLPTETAPKDTPFYGERSSRAANPDATLDSNRPKIDGQQEKLIRTEDSRKPKEFPLQPSPPQEQAQKARPKNDLLSDLAKLDPSVRRPQDRPADASLGEDATSRPARPRTLAAVRDQAGPRAGERMRQDGGTKRRGRVAPDVEGSRWGAYDAEFIRIVEQNWHRLIDNTRLSFQSGKVVLQFQMTFDGRILDLKIEDNTTQDFQGFLCERSILDSVPYRPWPREMRTAMGNMRSVQFTFYYE